MNSLPDELLAELSRDSLLLFRTSKLLSQRLYNIAMREFQAVVERYSGAAATDPFGMLVRKRNNNRLKPAFVMLVNSLVLMSAWMRRYPGKYPRYIMCGHIQVIKYYLYINADYGSSSMTQRYNQLLYSAAMYSRIDVIEYAKRMRLTSV